MNKIQSLRYILGVILVLLHINAYAMSQEIEDKLSTWGVPTSIYMTLEAGSSYAMHTKIYANPAFWDPTSENYHDALGASEVLGADIGYVLSPLLRFDIGVEHRNSYQYKRYHSAENALVFVGRTRYFNLSNTTVMGTIFANGSGLAKPICIRKYNYMLDPYIGFGIGAAFNTLDNLHSVQDGAVGVAQNRNVFSYMPSPNTTRVFAYQFIAGLDLKTSNKLAIGVNYRFLDAGHFRSSNYVGDGRLNGQTVPTWSGLLKANEIYATVKYLLV